MSTPASDVYERLKTNGKAMKITLLRLTTINKETSFGRTFTETTIFIHEGNMKTTAQNVIVVKRRYQ